MDIDEISRIVGAATIGTACALGILCLCYAGGWLLYKAWNLWDKRKENKQSILHENELLRKELDEIKGRIWVLDEGKSQS